MSSSLKQDSALRLNGTTETYPLFGWRLMFYLLHPNEAPDTNKLSDVPNYANSIIPVFLCLILGELAVKYYYTGKGFRINDTITSLGAGMASQTLKFITRSLDVVVYVWIFENYRLWTLPLRMWWSWGLAFLAADLAYYWLHRLNHEVAILWASHQTHHSSEEYNLSTALRQSITGAVYGWFLYLPMAFFGFTPVAHVVHVQLNTLFQFWVHTAVIKKLGPLEWVLNTPSHHRVHHGRNAYCIDKNYAGALIIWDRMFGTFEPEHDEEPVVYGIISPVNSFNGLWVQFNVYISTIQRALAYKSLEDKIKCLVMGPGWYPGTKRLGNPDDVPAIESPVRLHNPRVPAWRTAYALAHFAVLMFFFQYTAANYQAWSTGTVYATVVGILISLGNIGSVMDDRRWLALAELARCGLIGMLVSKGGDMGLSAGVALAARLFFAASSVLWTVVLADRSFTAPPISMAESQKAQ